MQPEDICPRPYVPPTMPTVPLSPPIQLSAVYRCADPEQANALLGGTADGYVYSRDRHPNGDELASKCAALHGAERAAVCSSGMAAMSAALLAHCQTGDHVVVSKFLYGKSLQLIGPESSRLGITSTQVDTCDLAATAAAFTPQTKLLVVETISNPLLRVADLPKLAALAHQHGALLLVDNTFAGPTVCRPLTHGADLVLESLTKIMNGHSDVLLGLLCGSAAVWSRIGAVSSAWGLSAPPFECWLAYRGLSTLALRAERANQNALEVARFLAGRPEPSAVHFPGLADHVDHALAGSLFGSQFGTMVTFTLPGEVAAATAFLHAAVEIPFCPSLGDLSTTASHPASTSHRGQEATALRALGISGGTIRLSVGIESPASILAALETGLRAAAKFA